MIVTYTPDGTDAQTWEFVPGKVRAQRSGWIEKLYSKLSGEKSTYEQFKVAVQQGSSPARRVLLWHLLQQIHPTLKVEDVDYAEDELVVVFDRDELADMRAIIERTHTVTDEDQRAQMLAAIDDQMETAPEGSGGKARPSSASSSTSSASPPTSPDSADPTSSAD